MVTAPEWWLHLAFGEGAVIGAVSGLLGTWLTLRSQRRQARESRSAEWRSTAYVEALIGLHRLVDIAGTLTYGPAPSGEHKAPSLPDLARARAALLVYGSTEVRRLNQALADRWREWQAAGQSVPPGVDSAEGYKERVAPRYQALRAALTAFEDQVNAELAPHGHR
jgi:hypothetical protein